MNKIAKENRPCVRVVRVVRVHRNSVQLGRSRRLNHSLLIFHKSSLSLLVPAVCVYFDIFFFFFGDQTLEAAFAGFLLGIK